MLNTKNYVLSYTLGALLCELCDFVRGFPLLPRALVLNLYFHYPENT